MADELFANADVEALIEMVKADMKVYYLPYSCSDVTRVSYSYKSLRLRPLKTQGCVFANPSRYKREETCNWALSEV